MKVHQALHGYNQGHNLLFSSINLPSQDEDYMKIQSDWTEYVDEEDDDSSYIKAYILPKSRLYVVSKSWYAYEMSRPGCVWTHSLIFNLNDVSIDFDFRSLLGYFVRPNGDKNIYDEVLDVNSGGECIVPHILDTFTINEIAYLYTTLLVKQNSIFLVEEKASTYQYLILSLLQFLPLEIVAESKLCSGVAINANSETNISFSYNVNRRLQDVKEENIESINKQDLGLLYIANAIRNQDTKVASILRSFTHEIGSKPERVLTFGKLLYGLECPDKTTYNSILENLALAFPNKDEGTRIKKAFLSPNVIGLFTSMDTFYADICVKTYENTIDFLSLFPYKEADKYIAHDIETFKSFLNGILWSDTISTYGNGLLEYEAQNISVEWQKDIYENNWNLYQSLLNFAPSWLYNKYWLEGSQTKIDTLLTVFEKIDLSKFNYWGLLLNVLLTSNDIHISYIVKSAIVRYYPNGVIEILNFIQNKNKSTELCHFICENRKQFLVQWIKNQMGFSYNVVEFITHILSPTSKEAKECGSLPWYRIMLLIQKSSDTWLYIYLYQLSFNWSDSTALKILKSSFWYLHHMFESNNICKSNINNLSPYLEELPPWQWWDNCKKLRKGLVKTMKKTGYNRNDIIDFTPSKEVNRMLLKLWDK